MVSERTKVVLAFVTILAFALGGIAAHVLTGKSLLEALPYALASYGLTLGSKMLRVYLVAGYFGIVSLLVGLVLWMTPRVKFMKKVGPFVWAIVVAFILCNCYVIPRVIHLDIVTHVSVAKQIVENVSRAAGLHISKLYAAPTSKPLDIVHWLLELGLPLSIALLLAGIDLRAIARTIGARPFLTFLGGSIGIILGGYAIIAILSHVPGFCPDTVKVVACKVAAWIGGSENDAAIFGMLHPSATWYAYHRIAGSIAYALWIAFVFGMAGTPLAEKINRFLRPTYDARRIAEEYRRKAEEGIGAEEKRKVSERDILLLTGYACLVTAISLLIEMWAGPKGIRVGGIPIPTVLLVTTFAIASATLARGLKRIPLTHQLGMYLLYLVVIPYIAAKTDFSKMVTMAYWIAVLFAAYMLMLAIHFATIVGVSRALRVDWTTTAVASIANVGGAVTAPLCASTYRVPELIPVAVIMANLGYAIANYLAYFAFAVPLNTVFPGVIPTH